MRQTASATTEIPEESRGLRALHESERREYDADLHRDSLWEGTSALIEPEALRCVCPSDGQRIIEAHRRVWESKPCLRQIYLGWYDRMAALMAPIAGPSIEVGSGPGTLKSRLPHVITSDVVSSRYVNLAADACRLPFATSSVANLLMVDVLHHLPRPQLLLGEAARLLRPGGRIVILDVFLSPMSWPIFRFLHPEPASLLIRPLNHAPGEPLFDPGSPWNSDQGIARAMFWKQIRRFRYLFPEFRIVHRECLSTLLWPLSGGFGAKSRLPECVLPLLTRLEAMLERLGRLTACRCLVALERTENGPEPDSDGRAIF